MTSKKTWKMSKDPLFRGDAKNAVCVPNPGADDSIVRHVMYLEGPGRETPYLSTSEEYQGNRIKKLFKINASNTIIFL